MKKSTLYWVLALAGGASLLRNATRVSIPKGARAARPFDLQKYLGKWYEIARLDYRWERCLSNVSADYTLRPDGSVKVTNRGWYARIGKWKKSTGKAKPVNTEDPGRLKVSFFGPFYAGYNVMAVDDNYQYALVFGNDLRFMWILSRNQYVPNDVSDKYIALARSAGYKTERLVWVKHDWKSPILPSAT